MTIDLKLANQSTAVALKRASDPPIVGVYPKYFLQKSHSAKYFFCQPAGFAADTLFNLRLKCFALFLHSPSLL